MISLSLPKVLSDVAALLSGTRARLQELPPAPSSDPGAFVLGLIMKFCADTDAYIRGSPESPTLVQRNRAAYEAFKVAIRRTAPPFVPCESAKTMPSSWRGTVIGGVSEESGAQKVMYLADAKAHIKESVPLSAFRKFALTPVLGRLLANFRTMCLMRPSSRSSTNFKEDGKMLRWHALLRSTTRSRKY